MASEDVKGIEAFLAALWSTREDEHGIILIWSAYFNHKTKRLDKARCDWADTIESAVAAARSRSREGREVYVGMGLRKKKLKGGERGGVDEVSAVCGLWVEVDYGESGHSDKKKYPPTEAEALALLKSAGLLPTVIVHTGHGLQGYWLFKEPWVFGGPDERRRFAAIVKAWNDRLNALAQQKGWTIDATADLARVFRVAGTVNHKVENAHVVARIVEVDGPRYADPDDFEGLLEIAAPEKEAVPGSFEELSAKRLASLKFPASQDIDLVRIDMLRDVDKKFDKSWRRIRTDLQDTSGSGYCLALANTLRKALLTDQEIVDILIFWRRMQKEPEKPPEWYVKRILDVMDRDNFVTQTLNEIKDGDTSSKILEGLSKLLGFLINGFLQVGRENAHYALTASVAKKKLKIILGTYKQTRAYEHVRGKIEGVLDLRLPVMTARGWGEVVDKLMEIKVVVDPTMGSTREALGAAMEHVLTKGQSLVLGHDDRDRAIAKGQAFIEDGVLSLRAESLTFALQLEDSSIDPRTVKTMLRVAGFKRGTISFRVGDEAPSSRSYYRITLALLAQKWPFLAARLRGKAQNNGNGK